ncbi:guanylate-binding protein 6-like [Oculina patagonica]
MADKRNGNMAIPLCLPNNCQWNTATGEYIKTGERRSSLYVVDEAVQKLQTVRGPVCVVSIAGPCRNGKSYVLSEAFEQPEVFPLGHLFDPKTMGIWMWVVPQKIPDSNGKECTVVLLDSEGIDAVSGEGLADNQIFTLTVLLASVLIYNSTGVPTRHDLIGLDFIVKLSQRIKLRSSNEEARMHGGQEDTEFFHKTFPFFIWLLRDVTQSIPLDCKDIEEYFYTRVFKDQGSSRVDPNQEVAESILRFFPGFHAFKLPPPTDDEEVLKNIKRNRSQINREFFSEIEQFKKLLRSTLVPKHSFNAGEIVTGEGLAALVQLYVEAINTPGVIPNVQTAWETFVVTKCAEAADAALKTYDVIMTSRLSGQLPCDNEEIRKSHEAALEQGIAQLKSETFGISTVTTEKYLKEVTEACDKNLVSWQRENESLTRESCTYLLKHLKKEHLDPVLAWLHGWEGAKVMFEDIVAGYFRIEQDYKARATGAKDACAAVFFECHPELMKEMHQYLGVLWQLKDFNENLIQEIAAKAYQDEERIKLDEEYARSQQENRKRYIEMETLQEKQAEETKRFREQKEAEAKAQRDQMDNMMKASKKQAEEDRRVLRQENQELKEQLVQMEESNDGMQQMVKKLTLTLKSKL